MFETLCSGCDEVISASGSGLKFPVHKGPGDADECPGSEKAGLPIGLIHVSIKP